MRCAPVVGQKCGNWLQFLAHPFSKTEDDTMFSSGPVGPIGDEDQFSKGLCLTGTLPGFTGGVVVSSSATAVPMPGHGPFGPDLAVNFTAWPRTCLITTYLPDDLSSWLSMAVIHGPVLLTLPGSCGAGHQLARSLPCKVPALPPCHPTRLLALHPLGMWLGTVHITHS